MREVSVYNNNREIFENLISYLLGDTYQFEQEGGNLFLGRLEEAINITVTAVILAQAELPLNSKVLMTFDDTSAYMRAVNLSLFHLSVTDTSDLTDELIEKYDAVIVVSNNTQDINYAKVFNIRYTND